MSHIRRPARLESLEDLMAFVSECAEAQGFRPKRVTEIQLAVEEALVNIFNYAYPENREGEVSIRCEPGDARRLLIEFRDKGIAYAFDDLGNPDTSASVADREVGGLGIFLIRQMVDDVQFRREGEENILTFMVEPRDQDAEPGPRPTE